MSESYIDTYYRRTIVDHSAYRALSGTQHVDVCVIGGGLAGLSTAHEALQRGLKVVLLEQNRIAWGASGRNGGFVTAGYATGHAQIVRRAGETNAKALHDLSVEVDFDHGRRDNCAGQRGQGQESADAEHENGDHDEAGTHDAARIVRVFDLDGRENDSA